MEDNSLPHSYTAISKPVHSRSVARSSNTLILGSWTVLMYLSHVGFVFSTHRHIYTYPDVILIIFELRAIFLDSNHT